MILVIGGSGFIGAHLVKEALLMGETVRVFDCSPFPEDEPWQPHELILGDLSDLGLLKKCMLDCHTVYHLAGIAHLWRLNVRDFDRINRQGTETVLEAAKQVGISRLIYTGTESILVPRKPGQVVTEDVQPVLKDMIGPYCRSKFLAEQAVFQAAKDGLPATVVSPTMPVGPGDRNLTPPGQMISSFMQGKIPAFIACTLNLVDVRDVALGHLQAARYGLRGQRMLLAGHNMTLKEFFQSLSQASGHPVPKIRIPYHLALMWSVLEQYLAALTGTPPTSSVTGVRLCRRSLAFDGSKTWHQLNHSPREFQETIAEAVAWHGKQLGR
jgi:dihydroflavonol-4-reductase